MVVPLQRHFEQDSRIGSASGAVAVAEPDADPLDVAGPFGIDLQTGVEADAPGQDIRPLFAIVRHLDDRGEESGLGVEHGLLDAGVFGVRERAERTGGSQGGHGAREQRAGAVTTG